MNNSPFNDFQISRRHWAVRPELDLAGRRLLVSPERRDFDLVKRRRFQPVEIRLVFSPEGRVAHTRLENGWFFHHLLAIVVAIFRVNNNLEPIVPA